MSLRDARRDSRRGERPSGADKDDPAYWRSIAEGDWLSLSDSEAFAAALADPDSGGSTAVDYRVGQVRSFALVGRERPTASGPRRRGPALGDADAPGHGAPWPGEYRFIELKREGEGPVYLAVVTGPGDGASSGTGGERALDLRAYFIPEGIGCGDRDELIDRGETWLFLPPPNPDDFISSELEYAPYPDLPEIEEPDGASGKRVSRKIVFGPAGAGRSLYGEARDSLAPVIITEYEAEVPAGEAPPENPLLFVLEEGWMRADGSLPEEGGYITVMLGKRLSPEDVEHWPA